MNGIYLYFVNKHLSSWPLLGLQLFTTQSRLLTTLTLYQTTKFGTWSNMKAFSDVILNVVQMMICVTDCVENVEKGEYAGYQHFLLCPQCFRKASFPGWLKVRTVW